MDSLDDLKLLLRSRHPLITIETVEEQRAEALVGRACGEIGIPLMVWTITSGLRRVQPPAESPIAGTEKVKAALGYLLETDYAAVYIFKDLPPHLGDAVNRRTLREVTQQFDRTNQTLVLVAEQKTYYSIVI